MKENEIVKMLESLDERCLRIALLVLIEKVQAKSVTFEDIMEALEIARSYGKRRVL